MAVVEYMVYKEGSRRVVPSFLSDCGHWRNPADNTFIGWVDDVRDFYVPDTLSFLTKEQFAARAVEMHHINPQEKLDPDNPEVSVQLTDQEVIDLAIFWYDDYVSRNSQQT